MCEILIKVRDYVNADPIKDRTGVHKRGDIINIKPDGWSDHPNWEQSAYPYANGGKFVLVKVPGLAVETALAYRNEWRDDLAYEVTGQNIPQGWYDVRVWEQAASVSGLNAIAADKRSMIEGCLTRWGCTNIAFSDGALSFRISLWDAVRSAEFWDVTALQLAQVSFELVSYSSGIGTIRVTVPESYPANEITSKITERGGVITSAAHPIYVFTIERVVLLSSFRQDVKRKAEQVYMRHRYAVSTAEVDAIIAAGGVMTITQAQLASRLRDKRAE